MGLRLALYSDQVIPANARMDLRLLQLIGVEHPRIGYISSAPDPSRAFFSAKKSYYAALGAELCHYVDSENIAEDGMLTDLLECDAVQLTGGNTYTFLAWLQRREVIPSLRDYARNRGTLVGTSAGAILMSPNIAIASISPHPRPPAMHSLNALDLVPFHFWPHYQPGQEAGPRESLFLSSTAVVYACPDGAGVIVDGDVVECIGPVKVFRYGRLDRLQRRCFS